MDFGWINLFGAVIVVLLLIPNIAYAMRHRQKAEASCHKILLLLEQIGRYGCIILMWFPLLIGKFGFSGVDAMVVYLLGNGVLVLCYFILWLCYGQNQTKGLALALSLVPVAIFLLSGCVLHHILLIFFAVLFGISHVTVTMKTK